MQIVILVGLIYVIMMQSDIANVLAIMCDIPNVPLLRNFMQKEYGPVVGFRKND